MTQPLFLPWVRRGLARAISTVDPLDGPLPRNPSLVTRVGLADDHGETVVASHEFELLGPGDVTAIDSSQILRMEPAPGTGDAEPNYFAQIELASPELPWLLTPAGATNLDALRPWMVLIVVAEREEVAFAAGVDGTPDTLTIDPSVIDEELWNLDDAWAWAHVHATCAATEVASRLDAGDGSVIARLMCPRRLRPATSYRAALVPAFDVGVDAALGVDTSAQTTIDAAWDLGQSEPVVLPLYASWRFATADIPGDFEHLCERLAPDTSTSRLGYQHTVLDTLGFDTGDLVPAAVEFEFAGALASPGTTAKPLPKASQQWLDGELVAVLDRSASRQQISPAPGRQYRPERDDPVVGPPLHGAWAADTFEVPRSGWLRELNLSPALRAAAGLGARVVRRHQHELLAGAWDQVGALREVTIELQRARLTEEVTRVHAGRLAALDDATLLFTVGASAAFRPTTVSGARSVRAAIRSSDVVPTGSVSAAFFRQARPSSSVGRALHTTTANTPSDSPTGSPTPAARAANMFLEAGDVTVESTAFALITDFRNDCIPDGAYVGQLQDIEAVPWSLSSANPLASASPLASTGPLATAVPLGGSGVTPATAVPRLRHVRSLRQFTPRTSSSPSGATIAGDVRSHLDSASSIVEGLDRRLTGLDLDRAGHVPTRVVIGPWFPDGLEPWLRRESPEFVLPGVSEFAMDRVRLLSVNEDTVAAFLVGANHEWAREALWHEFPADLAATAFASFFDRPGDPVAPGPDTDLASDIHTWAKNRRLSSFVGGGGTSTVVLLRAELVRRYPDLIVSLLEPVKGAPPISGDALLPDHVTDAAYRGRIDGSTVFVGFDIDPSVVLDKGWYVSIEEHPSGPRFGLDVAAGNPGGQPPDDWEELNWRHVNAVDPGAQHIDLGRMNAWAGTERDGLVWARNSAHQAAITFQRPFRMIFPASALLGGGQ